MQELDKNLQTQTTLAEKLQKDREELTKARDLLKEEVTALQMTTAEKTGKSAELVKEVCRLSNIQGGQYATQRPPIGHNCRTPTIVCGACQARMLL